MKRDRGTGRRGIIAGSAYGQVVEDDGAAIILGEPSMLGLVAAVVAVSVLVTRRR